MYEFEKVNQYSKEAIGIAQRLIVITKISAINFKTLHRNLKGGNWFTIHEKLNEYYSMFDAFEDRLIENLMGLGIEDKSIKDSMDLILDVKPYEEKEAMIIAKNMLLTELAELENTRNALEIPSKVASVFDEIENYIHLEADYKIAQYLE